MKPEEEAAFTEKLARQYVLIPKDRLYHLIGGFLAFLVAAFGINIAAVVGYMHSQPAVQASKEIERIRAQVKQHYQDLGVGTFLRRDEAGAFLPKSAETNFLKSADYYFVEAIPNKTSGSSSFFLHVHDDHYANAEGINLAVGRPTIWKLVPVSK